MAGLSQLAVEERTSSRRLNPDRQDRPRRTTWLVEFILLNAAVLGNSVWLIRAVAALLLAVLPGQLLLPALQIPGASVRRYVAYLPCASVAVLIGSSLVVDLVGPLFGAHEPLRLWPLLVGLDLALIALAAIAVRAPASCDFEVSDLIGRARWLWPLILPLISAAAVARLDNGSGNGLAMVVLLAVALTIPVCTALADRMDSRQVSLLLYGAGLSLMLLTSMRSSYVIGFDISSEYFDFHQTVVSGIWHAGHLNPYEAMLSLTVLPASLHALIGGQDVWIFKLGYPALFAFFPVAVFALAARFLSTCRVSGSCDRHCSDLLLPTAARGRQAGAGPVDIRRSHGSAARYFAGTTCTSETDLGVWPDTRVVSLLNDLCSDRALRLGRLAGLDRLTERKDSTSAPAMASRRTAAAGVGSDLVFTSHPFGEQPDLRGPVTTPERDSTASGSAKGGKHNQRLFQWAARAPADPPPVRAGRCKLLQREFAQHRAATSCEQSGVQSARCDHPQSA